MQCSNNMKQFGLALHTYHDTFELFPASRAVLNNFNTNANATDTLHNNHLYWRGIVGTIVFLLPYSEHNALYEVIETSSRTVAANSWPWGFDGYRIPTLYCPSDPNSSKPNTGMSRMNIMVSHGDGMWHNNRPDLGENPTSRISKRGIFAPLTHQGISDCTDGTSNTIAASESVSGENRTTELKGGIFSTSLIIVDVGGGVWNAVPAACLTEAPSTTDPGLLNTGSDTWRGMFFTDGRTSSAGFCTVLQPNSPSCLFLNPSLPDHMGWGVFSASSNHSGGVNGVFVDGSVRFISNAIHAGNASSPQVLSGNSPYGVWGAAGTPNGEESAQLP
jgi:prepilin-type processing-associated H-X9-DG protein